MDIYKEITELGAIWKSYSIIGKVFLVLATLISIMSLGSLADTVFSFKGFIIEGIRFYREITDPIRVLLSNLIGYKIPQFIQDGLVVISIWFGVCGRVSSEGDEEKMREGWALGLIFVALFLIGAAIQVALILLVGSSSAALLLLLPLVPFLTVIVKKKFQIEKRERLMFLYILGIYLFVACLAAISEGLTRSAVGLNA